MHGETEIVLLIKQAKRNSSTFSCVYITFFRKKDWMFLFLCRFVLRPFPVNLCKWHFLGFFKSIT